MIEYVLGTSTVSELVHRARGLVVAGGLQMRLHSIVAAALAFPAVVSAQPAPTIPLDGLEGAAVLEALARECYEAGLVPEMPIPAILDCSAVVEERSLGAAARTPGEEQRIVVTHRVRFTLLERAGEGRIGAEAWTETEELGSVIEQPVASNEYLERVQRVLTTVAARLRARGAPPWVGRHENEQAWHLAAHLRAVSHCDTNLASMTAASVASDLESAGLYPLHDDTRDRCEQLHTLVFEWGLARGDAQPSLAGYLKYRAALPPEQRACSGQLAPDARCPP